MSKAEINFKKGLNRVFASKTFRTQCLGWDSRVKYEQRIKFGARILIKALRLQITGDFLLWYGLHDKRHLITIEDARKVFSEVLDPQKSSYKKYFNYYIGGWNRNVAFDTLLQTINQKRWK